MTHNVDAPGRLSTRLSLPRPLSVLLRRFSLYDNAPSISADFGDGVFCLAGANGLGKSTFLAALNFAITGIVADPSRKFESVEEYHQYSVPYSTTYFRGRISDEDRAEAEVELVMRVGERTYQIIRGMFEPTALRSLTIASGDGVADYNGPEYTDADRHAIYAREVAGDAGLAQFEQLVFLQHFVLTFDERRHLLFWDERVTQAALFIAFGVDLEAASRAENLRRAAEKADSRARNLQWQATEIKKRLRDLNSVSELADEDVVAEHRALLGAQEETARRVEQLTVAVEDARLRVADESARYRATRDHFEEEFASQFSGRTPPSAHPLVAQALQASACAVCASEGPEVRTAVQRRLDDHQCPLCSTPLPKKALEQNAAAVERLQRLDEALTKHGDLVRHAEANAAELEGLLDRARSELRSVTEQVARFERENERSMVGVLSEGTALQVVASQYQAQIAELLARKKREVERKTAAKRDLKKLQQQLAAAYLAAETDFVPRFAGLANEFLGLDLQVEFQIQGATAQLVLTVQNTRRRAQDMLSESQRFFIDIALRMALAQQMADGAASCLFVDTPEGSLDIAYESRAGRMFGLFVRDGHQMIMTANINTSQLLQRLARTCGPSKMRMLRMTEWTSLSEVQIDEEHLFDSAYSSIEAALVAGG